MNDIQNIITERVDDTPLLLEQRQRMHLPPLLDDHCPTHGNWQGLSLGWGSTLWLSSIVSRGDHRLGHVEPWVNNRLWTLRKATGQAVEQLDGTDDRLALVLQYVRDDRRWAQFESALNQHTVRVYDRRCERMHVESTTASAYATVRAAGLFQFGPSKDHRPDLPQGKGRQGWPPWACLWPPMWWQVNAPMLPSLPCIKRLHASRGRRGLC
jgi:transposase